MVTRMMQTHFIRRLLAAICLIGFCHGPTLAQQQQPAPADANNQGVQPNQAGQANLGNLIGGAGFGGLGIGAPGFAGPGNGGMLPGAQGGAAAADFDSLIDLIISTVSADSWMENGTGEGEIQPFPTGVYADASGTLRFNDAAAANLAVTAPPKPATVTTPGDVRRTAELRYISLPRLEQEIQRRQLEHLPLSEEMLTLAGLQRVEYVFVLEPTEEQPGDVILAGPAGDWYVREDGKIVSVEVGQPIVRLDDLLTLWRRQVQGNGGPFGVSINPRQAGLARVQQFVAESNAKPIEPSQRRDWLEQLRASLGEQDVQFFGISGDSHVARVLLVADYHMKLIGMGIADGVDGVISYLKTVRVGADGSVPPMTVLRWWFSMAYLPVATDAERTVYQLRGPGAKVLSENEMLAARGQRVHTGKSEELNLRFARSFSEQFAAICQKYPLYTELRNVFDLAMVLTLIENEQLVERAGWQPTSFASSQYLPLPKMSVPTEVDTVINHRVIRRRHIVAGVSGGVWIDARKNLQVEAGEAPSATAKAAPLVTAGEGRWWWD